MEPLFPPWSNSAMWLGLGAIAITVLGSPLLLMLWVRTPYVTDSLDPVEQPVLFDHRHHAGDDGIDCRYCHWQVEKGAAAGIPPTELCMNCHSQIWNESPQLEPVRRSWYGGAPIPWKRVNLLPDFVYFNHAIHVNKGVGCVSCHGRVDRMARVYQAAPLTMEWCLACHRDPLPHLQPPSTVTDMSWAPGQGPPELQQELVRRLHVEPPTYCTACHR